MGSWVEHYGGVHFTYTQFVFLWNPCGGGTKFQKKFGSSFDEAAQDISDVMQIDGIIASNFEKDMDYVCKQVVNEQHSSQSSCTETQSPNTTIMSTTVQDRVQIYCSDSWVERAVFQKDQKCSRAKLYRINDFPRLRRPEKDIYRDRYNVQQAELLKTLNRQVQQSIASIKRRRASEQQSGEIEIWIYVHGFRGNEHDLRYLKDFQQL